MQHEVQDATFSLSLHSIQPLLLMNFLEIKILMVPTLVAVVSSIGSQLVSSEYPSFCLEEEKYHILECSFGQCTNIV